MFGTFGTESAISSARKVFIESLGIAWQAVDANDSVVFTLKWFVIDIQAQIEVKEKQ